ncbi:hypothetical protein [Haloferax volcanii]
MSEPNPIEVLIPVLVFGIAGFLVFGPLGAGIGCVIGIAIGVGFSTTNDD